MDLLETISDHWILALIILLLTICYYRQTVSHNYFKSRGIAFIKPPFLVGNLGMRLLKKISFHDLQVKLYNDLQGEPYGGIFGEISPSLMLRDPELIKTILIKDFDYFVDRPFFVTNQKDYINKMLINLKGSEWKLVRRVMTPTFTSSRIRSMSIIINQCAKQMINFIENEKGDGPLEMKKFMGRYTLDVIGSCAFGIECESLKSKDAEFVKIAERYGELSKTKLFVLYFVMNFMPSALKYMDLSFANIDVTDQLVDILSATKKRRSDQPETRRNDLLQILIDAVGEEKEKNKTNTVLHSTLTESTIDGQLILFLLAGFETTSTLLSFAAYELALNPVIQGKLRHEVREVIKKHNGECTYDALAEMEYLDMVVMETLRKHPPIGRIERVCSQPYKLQGTNLSFKVGDLVTVSIIGLHMDPTYYPRPEEFDPERFTPTAKQARPATVFLPFGAGPRNCIGLRFGLVTAKLALAQIIDKFEFKASAKTTMSIQYGKISILLNPGEIWLDILPLK